MRTTTIPAQTVSENIQSFEHHIGVCVNVIVGIGQEVDGVFVYTVPQQFSSLQIKDQAEVRDSDTNAIVKPQLTDYTDLIAASGQNFAVDDLWPFVDLIRNRTAP